MANVICTRMRWRRRSCENEKSVSELVSTGWKNGKFMLKWAMPARTVHAPVRPICPQTRMGWACWHGVVGKNGKKIRCDSIAPYLRGTAARRMESIQAASRLIGEWIGGENMEWGTSNGPFGRIRLVLPYYCGLQHVNGATSIFFH